MTDNEIIKAMEHCSDEDIDTCIGCTAFNERDMSSCIGFRGQQGLLGQALDLINRLKSENELMCNYILDRKLHMDLLSYSKRKCEVILNDNA